MFTYGDIDNFPEAQSAPPLSLCTLHTHSETHSCHGPHCCSEQQGSMCSPHHPLPLWPANRSPYIFHKFSVGKIKDLKDDNELCVPESNDITRYLSRGSSRQRQQLRCTVGGRCWCAIIRPVNTSVSPPWASRYIIQSTEGAEEELRAILWLLVTHLKPRTFLVHKQVTLAGFMVLCISLWFYYPSFWVFESSSFQAFHSTNCWLLACIHQPLFKMPWDQWSCEKMAQLEAKKLAESQANMDSHGKREVQKKKSWSPRLGGKGPPSQLLRRWATVSRHRLLSPRPPSCSCPSELCVGEFKCKHSREVTLSMALPSLIRTTGPRGSSLLPFWSIFWAFTSCSFVTGGPEQLEKLGRMSLPGFSSRPPPPAAPLPGCESSKGERLPFCWVWVGVWAMIIYRTKSGAWSFSQNVGKAFNQGKILSEYLWQVHSSPFRETGAFERKQIIDKTHTHLCVQVHT